MLDQTLILTKIEVFCDHGWWRFCQGHDKQVWQVAEVWRTGLSKMAEEDALSSHYPESGVRLEYPHAWIRWINHLAWFAVSLHHHVPISSLILGPSWVNKSWSLFQYYVCVNTYTYLAYVWVIENNKFS